MSPWIFYPLAALSVAGALGVVLAANPVRSAMALVATLVALAACFVALEAHLVAALQIIVYAGAVMVLFLFVIMLLNLQEDLGERGRGGLKLAAVATAAALAALVSRALWDSSTARAPVELPEGFGTTRAIAESMFTEHLVAFELTSVLLLVAVVGAVVLARREPDEGEAE